MTLQLAVGGFCHCPCANLRGMDTSQKSPWRESHR